MTIVLDGHDLSYDMGNLCFMFFPGEKVNAVSPGCDYGGDFVYTRLKRLGARTCALVTICRAGRRERSVSYAANDAPDYAKQCEMALARAFYRAASAMCGYRPPWGILTGIRPAKLVRGMLAQGIKPEEVKRRLAQDCYVGAKKIELCLETAGLEENIVRLSRPESVSLYISIPFCPTRCLYCSFISHDIQKSAKLLPEYVRLLCLELESAAKIVDRLGLRLETVYIGGGTPTVLSAQALRQIFETVEGSFNLGTLREYTVEAGRPDTITEEKLKAIKRGGAGRICINPQTLDDDILKTIGRSHTSGQIFEAFALARAEGIESVNMDLIAGLPGDTAAGFAKTLDGVTALNPEGITVHTLAMKRSSRLVTEGGAVYNPRGEEANAMLELAAQRLSGAGYLPYYLYRQRNTTGNLENVGFAKPGMECLYNIFIMDETHTIISVGAGGVTKLRAPGGGRIERIFNFKYPYEYISRFGEILDRKKQVEKFYDDNHWENKDFEGFGE
jgi:oxygen-independent coproporphyrinogen-3 oxidase